MRKPLIVVGLCALAALPVLRDPQHPIIERTLSFGVIPAFLMKVNDERMRLAELRIVSTAPLVVERRSAARPRTVPASRTNVAGGEM